MLTCHLCGKRATVFCANASEIRRWCPRHGAAHQRGCNACLAALARLVRASMPDANQAEVRYYVEQLITRHGQAPA